MKDMATVARIAEQGRRAAVDKLPILPRRPLPFPIEPEYEAVDAEEAFLLIDAQDARIAELEKERDEARFAPLGDNHHNAAKCPYCRPTFQDGIKRIAELEREIREAHIYISSYRNHFKDQSAPPVDEWIRRNA